MKTQFLLSLILTLILTSFTIDKKPKHPFGKKFKAPKNYVYIPSGILKTSLTDLTVAPFFMSKTEISNQDYNEFLKDLKKLGNQNDYDLAKRKTKKWNNEPFAKNYHLHPSYAEYPVVTISKKAAEMYCQWLTKKLQPKYKKFNINFRLPTEHEWVYAARAGHHHTPYPWGGYYLRNNKGCFLANFKRMNSSNINYDRATKTYKINEPKFDPTNFPMPAPVKSFFPNDFGLYNMSGNAAEMVSTNSLKNNGGFRTKGGCYDSVGGDIQIEGPDEFDGWTEPSQYIGFRPIMSVTLK